MNLLIDPWVPVLDNGKTNHVTLKKVLCTDEDFQISLSRDDMELAALQLLICLTQVVFMPEDTSQLSEKTAKPLTESDYDAGISGFKDMFVLGHPVHPFMQTRGVKASENTSIQKLFIGLPEGNNHSFFNDPGEISIACPSCVAIALFNQASNCPSFGGGFKGSLRGSAPISTFIEAKNLRQNIWNNVLCPSFLKNIIPWHCINGLPVWINPVNKEQKIYVHQIDLLRGLFWQPSHVEINWISNKFVCKSCGTLSQEGAQDFKKEKFNYEIQGIWPHPHSPMVWKTKKGTKNVKFASFTSTAPAWTMLNTFLIKKEEENEGNIPAAVITQYKNNCAGNNLHLLVGGYQVKQASVLQRRHELFTLPLGWDNSIDTLDKFILLALEIKNVLRKKSYGLSKSSGVSGISKISEESYYKNSELIIHEVLRQMDWREAANAYKELFQKLSALAKQIFNEISSPYQHEPKMLKQIAKSRKNLNIALSKLIKNKGKSV